ncbi:MAG: MBL fold metallo-hydrolase [Sedimentisphaerales bacterium]|nr:MBL fold metallo-hydrolase [Sedimentisphaerales bacterium]
MKIDRLILGDFQTNCYVVRADEATTDCLIVDTGLDRERLPAFLRENILNPTTVVLTHGHADHIAGLTVLRQQYPELKVYIHRLDAGLLADAEANLSTLAGAPLEVAPADVLLEDGDTVREAGITLKVLHTPGHTPGGICLYAESEGLVFSGDTLFAEGIGRTDFPGGDTDQLLRSIRSRLLTLPDTTSVYPGHAMRTTIAHEKTHNPFLV